MTDHTETPSAADTLAALDTVSSDIELIYWALAIETDGALAGRIAHDADLQRLLLDLARRLKGPVTQAQAISRARVAPDLNALRDQLLDIVDADDENYPPSRQAVM